MSGIYVHIPFCRKACSYCNFYFSTNLKTKPDLLEALLLEVDQRASSFEKTDTLYFGGGTPSVLTLQELDSILEKIKNKYDINPEVEVTLEANPEDINASYLDGLLQLGVNRLSMGVQSFHGEDLIFMNRNHTKSQTVLAIEMAKKAGFERINLDLIYGSPTTTDEMWRENVEEFLNLDIDHLSSYCLTSEPKTALANWIEKGKVNLDDEKSSDQFHYLIDTLEASGYEQYEISNFCKNGSYAIHNTSYWQGRPYIGYGPAAHSFDGQKRRWNVANNQKYIQALHTQIPYFEEEKLDLKDRYNEYIMTGLRTKWGINKYQIEKQYGTQTLEYFLHERLSNPYKEWLKEDEGGNVTIAKEGKFFSDAIASSFFMV